MEERVENVICPYCENPAVYMTSHEFYGKKYKSNLYVCKPCDARVGTHGKGKTPLGTMANGRLRNLRMMCHARIDPMWQKREMSRGAVYKRLQNVMSMTTEEAHIGMFDEEHCMKLIAIFDKGEF